MWLAFTGMDPQNDIEMRIPVLEIHAVMQGARSDDQIR
jgi:hypothetical protein